MYNEFFMIKKKILILGAGVSGLSSGILLLQKGYDVTIWSKDFPPNTTSNKAAAAWYPVLCESPEKSARWLKMTLKYFHDNFIEDLDSGCYKTQIIEIFDHEKEDPWWKDASTTYKKIDSQKLPAGYVDGYEIEGLIIQTNKYMDYLVNLFKNLGGTMKKKYVTNINEALNEDALVVNCTGLGSRELLGDDKVYPVRGQTVIVKQNGFDYTIFDMDDPRRLAYIIARKDDIVLGGTAQENNWSLDISEEDTKEILQKCAKLSPRFKHVDIIGYKVGLRPTRKEIRVEAEKIGGKNIVHNYGHGGDGFTLSWGCALDVLDLVENI